MTAEAAALRDGDIPHFTVAVGNGTIRAGAKELGRLTPSPADRFRERILGPDHKMNDLAVLEAAFARPSTGQLPIDDLDDTAFAKAARQLAAVLRTQQIVDDSGRLRAVVGGIVHSSGLYASVGPLQGGLYSGLPGLALSHAAATLTGPSTVAANGYLDLSRQCADDGQAGLFGRVSDHYVEALLRQRSPENVTRLSKSENLDVVGGVAGEVLSILGAARSLTDEDSARFFSRLERAWRTEWSDSSQAGMAHGALGMAFAAVRSAHRSGEPALVDRWLNRFLDVSTSLATLASTDHSYGAISWCRGYGGVCAAGLALESTLGVEIPRLGEWLDWLFEHHALATGRSLCCGYGSIVDVLATLRASGRPEPANSPAILSAWIHQPQNPRLPEDLPMLGFMQGLAGQIYTLVRLTDQGRGLPCVLSFDGLGVDNGR